MEPNLPLFEETYSVSELCTEIHDFLAEAFPSVWVAGEIQRLRLSRRGHLYFELVEKGEGDAIVGKLDAVVWRTDYQRIARLLGGSGQELAEGLQIRSRGKVDFYGAGGRLQLVVREVDPVFTLGLLAARRRETLAALAAAGLLERNRQLALPDLPLSIALITSHGSAAYHDFLSTLGESGYGFRVLLLHAAVQGRTAEREVASALGALRGLAVDCAVLIRGGGSRTDLAVFDSRVIAEAVALAPLPVITGLGHEIDESIADLVAHTALKTPTKAAEFLVERVARRELDLAELRRALRREALEPLRRGREALGRAERGVALARLRLAAVGARLGEAGRTLSRLGRACIRQAALSAGEVRRRLGAAAPRRTSGALREHRRLAERIAAEGRGRVREMEATLRGLSRLAAQLGPEQTLERGYSITRDSAGVLVRTADQVPPGERIVTRLSRGELTSRVEEG